MKINMDLVKYYPQANYLLQTRSLPEPVFHLGKYHLVSDKYCNMAYTSYRESSQTHWLNGKPHGKMSTHHEEDPVWNRGKLIRYKSEDLSYKPDRIKMELFRYDNVDGFISRRYGTHIESRIIEFKLRDGYLTNLESLPLISKQYIPKRDHHDCIDCCKLNYFIDIINGEFTFDFKCTPHDDFDYGEEQEYESDDLDDFPGEYEESGDEIDDSEEHSDDSEEHSDDEMTDLDEDMDD